MFPRNLSIELVKAQMPLNKEVWTFCSFTSCERTARLKLSQTAWLILSSIYSSRPEVFLQAARPSASSWLCPPARCLPQDSFPLLRDLVGGCLISYSFLQRIKFREFPRLFLIRVCRLLFTALLCGGSPSDSWSCVPALSCSLCSLWAISNSPLNVSNASAMSLAVLVDVCIVAICNNHRTL